MAGRWKLNRAGIINVYQYGDETIDLAGGRLLLRGVNGSGKSTAMNMLLPFLIEADVRRIDAAGEQTGVLRSWMLSGREESNPVGYLWIEFARVEGDTGEFVHLVCGCGIRASASTDRVTTWWFVTDRRPGIDFSFVDRRTPLAADALRSVLGTQAVFSDGQRAEYRRAVRARLFGGADLDQHVRLLHIVRSPRVGDRIDAELPAYLEGALPQLSEAALADAAQPLEDLDEHRNNVAALERTAAALEGLSAIYESYARRELHAAAKRTEELHGTVQKTRRDRREADAALDAATRTLASVEATVKRLEDDDARIDTELQALRQSPAYTEGQSLIDLRERVASLAHMHRQAEGDAAAAARKREDAARRVGARRGAFTDAVGALRVHLDDVAAIGTPWHLVTPMEVPSVASSNRSELSVGDLALPVSGTIDLAGLRSAFTRTITRAEIRSGEIAEVVGLLDVVERHERALRNAEARRDASRAAAARADGEADEARAARLAVEKEWRALAERWLEGVNDSAPAGVAADERFAVAAMIRVPDLLSQLDELPRALTNAAQLVADHFRGVVERTASRRDQQHAEAERCAAVCDALARAVLPEPPSGSWQRSSRRTVLAEVIEFESHVGLDDQLGIEAAMEASGLLGAEVLDSGVLALATGELVAVARSAEPVSSPLSSFVRAITDDGPVSALLRAITTDRTVDAETTITTDGEFRLGALRGRHTKTLAEHIGVTNRRAALERQRAEAAVALAEAKSAVEATEAELAECRRHLHEVNVHRDALPSTQPVVAALARSDAAERSSVRAHEAADEAAGAATAAEAALASAEADGRRVAASHRLPFDRAQLGEGARATTLLIAACRGTEPLVSAVEVTLAEWSRAGDDWHAAVSEHEERVERARSRDTERREQQAKLATLEDTVGTAWEELVEIIEATDAEQKRTRRELQEARSAVKAAAAEESRTAEVARTAADRVLEREQACAATLGYLRSVIAVSGLVASALTRHSVDGPSDEASGSATVNWPAVSDSADGALELANAIVRSIPQPERADVGAEGVRNSLRQRRGDLGAGWDAEDHQADAALPLAIQVTGPLGRMPLADATAEVSTQLRSQSSLLTAKQDQALRNLLQGVVATEVATKMFAAAELVKLMNSRLSTVTTAHGIGASLRWRRRDDVDPDLASVIDLLAKKPDLRDADEDATLATALSHRIDSARRDDPDATYRDLIGRVFDYRRWHEMAVLVHRPNETPKQLAKHPRLSEGEKKVVSYLPLFAAVAASCDALSEVAPAAPRFLMLDDAFAKVSEDNHGPLFGLLVELDLDFIATSERLWGTHASVPELSICEVVRDATMNTIFLERSRWDGRSLGAALEESRSGSAAESTSAASEGRLS